MLELGQNVERSVVQKLAEHDAYKSCVELDVPITVVVQGKATYLGPATPRSRGTWLKRIVSSGKGLRRDEQRRWASKVSESERYLASVGL